LTSRKLVDELNVEWKIAKEGNPTLLMLIFEDILVFLDTKDINALKPLSWTANKTKHTFSAIIPLKCIKSMGPMPDKRGFHIVVLMDEDARPKVKTAQTQQPQPQQKSIETQMLFLLYTASLDIRTRCLDSLQALTGKVTVNAPIQIDPTQSKSKLSQNQESIDLTSNTSNSVSMSNDFEQMCNEEVEKLKSMLCLYLSFLVVLQNLSELR
jgi:hypothetical protein